MESPDTNARSFFGTTCVPHAISKDVPCPIPVSLEGVAKSDFFIRRLYVDARVGSHPWGQDAPQTLMVDVEYTLPSGLSCMTDLLDDTIDHLTVAQHLRKCGSEAHHASIEALARHMVDQLQERFDIPWVVLTVVQRRPHPVTEEGITIEVGVRCCHR